MSQSVVKPIPEICKNCRFWKPSRKVESKSEFGSCRRYPPEVIIYDDQVVSMNPVTEWKESCGEFRVRHDS